MSVGYIQDACLDELACRTRTIADAANTVQEAELTSGPGGQAAGEEARRRNSEAYTNHYSELYNSKLGGMN